MSYCFQGFPGPPGGVPGSPRVRSQKVQKVQKVGEGRIMVEKVGECLRMSEKG